MPGGWSVVPSLSGAADIASQTSTSSGTAFLSSASANTKGTYTQLIASTARDCCGVLMSLVNSSASGVEFSTDLAIGGSGSEQILIPDLISYGLNESSTVFFPLQIPAGTRVAARCQCTTGSTDCTLQVHLFDGDWATTEGHSSVDTYGFVSASTRGTSVDPGGTANTKGAWSQVTASTTNDICGIALGLDCAGVTGTASAVQTLLLDIGVGAGGSEQVVLSNLEILQINQSSGLNGPTLPSITPMVYISIPAGSRIAARAQSSLNTATQRTMGVVVYGLRT